MRMRTTRGRMSRLCGNAASAAAAPGGPDYYSEPVTRNLALELVRVTEAAALAGGKWLGRGDKNKVLLRRASVARCGPCLEWTPLVRCQVQD